MIKEIEELKPFRINFKNKDQTIYTKEKNHEASRASLD